MESATYTGDPSPRVVPSGQLGSLVRRLIHGDARALARAISLVENDASEAPALLSACFPSTGRALRIGITGAPGAGKSTLVNRLARSYRDAGKTLGVLAVDPSSPFTGGAILGDRIRVRDRHDDPGFYFRSMATRGALGGLALAAADVALLIEASGKDIVLIETVGVGQDEVEIARLADITLVILVPGMGDDVQSLKAGVMEIADLYVINKSDREGADRVEQEIRSLQSLVPTSHHSQARSLKSPSDQMMTSDEAVLKGHGFSRAAIASDSKGASAPEAPPAAVVRTIATTGHGMDSLVAAIATMENWLAENDRLPRRRAQNWQRRLDRMLRAELMRRARQNGLSEDQLRDYAARVAARVEDPWSLVARLASNLLTAESQTENKP